MLQIELQLLAAVGALYIALLQDALVKEDVLLAVGAGGLIDVAVLLSFAVILFFVLFVVVLIILFVIAIFGGAVMGENLAWDIADTLNGMMMIPNLIGVLVLCPVVYRITKNYVDRHMRGQDIEPMLSNFKDIQDENAPLVRSGKAE